MGTNALPRSATTPGKAVCLLRFRDCVRLKTLGTKFEYSGVSGDKSAVSPCFIELRLGTKIAFPHVEFPRWVRASARCL